MWGLSLVAANGGFSLAAVCRLLTVVASSVSEYGLQRSVVVLHGMWDLPRFGIKPGPPALAADS